MAYLGARDMDGWASECAQQSVYQHRRRLERAAAVCVTQSLRALALDQVISSGTQLAKDNHRLRRETTPLGSKVAMSNHKLAHDVRSADRLGLYASAIAAVGALASGPVAVAIVGAVEPQPPWITAWLFAAHFHTIQLLPFLCGFVLIGGFVALVTSIRAQLGWERRATSALAQTTITMYATLASFNYIAQLAFVPALARHYVDSYAPLLAAFTMTHPGSLAWALEMWSYAFLGIATWLLASFFSGDGVEAVARWSFRSNGPVSVVAALWSVVRPGWELSRGGLIAFAIWNVLALAMAVSAFWVFRIRLRGYVRGHGSHRDLHVDLVPLP